MSNLKVTNIQHASAASAAITLASDGTAAATLSSVNGGPLSGTRNRIINGDMRIDQRNAGGSVSTPPNYVLDRWKIRYSSNGGTAGSCTVQRSATAPDGFVNSQLLTVGTARTVVSGDRFGIEQPIEGFNISDLGWGTAAAQSVTVSFWVRSSVTGSFGLCLSNFSRGISALYAVNAANTWERKTVTFVGDTAGTWDTTNGTGALVVFDLGMGSDVRLATGAWSAGTYLGATGGTNLVSTSGATFYITGVQLEAGSVATPFERRSYGQELSLCQRYYQRFDGLLASGYNAAGGVVYVVHSLPVEMRAAPTVSLSNFANANASNATVNLATTKLFRAQTIITNLGPGYSAFSAALEGAEL